MSEVHWNGKRSLWVGPWKNIRKGWEKFASYPCFEVGVGFQVLFWKYHWDSNGTFQDRYPELFRFARDKKALVSDYFDWVKGQLHWKPVFIIEAQVWELDSMAQFFG